MPALHLAVLLFGVAGLFGKLLTLSPVTIVLGRVFFASLALALVLRWRKVPLWPARAADGLRVVGLGVLLAVHWITFFHAIQLSSVAVGLLTFATFPVFTAFLEPLMAGERVRGGDVALALVTFAGVALVIPRPDLASDLTRGALWGVVSGATFSVLSILNRRYVQRLSALALAFQQDLVATVVLLPALLVLELPSGVRDLALLVVLGVLFTAVAHALFIQGLRSVRARTASIVASLEPVYGIAFAFLLLGERPGPRVLAGGALIVGATLLVTLRSAPPRPGTPVPPG